MVSASTEHVVVVGSARERAHAQIRESIIRAEFPPGSRLSENDLADRLDMSRQPIREALVLLAEERLVVVRPQSGTYVALIDRAEVEQAQFIREAIELASLLRARPLAPVDVEAVEQIIAAQRLAPDRNAFYPLDERFHRYLLGLSGHQTAWATVTRSKSHLDRARYLGIESTRSLTDFADDHERVFQALLRGDVAGAVAELRAHLRQILRDLEALEAQVPDYFA